MSGYNKTRSGHGSAEDHYNITKARIEKIQSQLAKAPRNEKLKAKVCIVTGVGSLKGIGYVPLPILHSQLLIIGLVGQHLYVLLTKVR